MTFFNTFLCRVFPTIIYTDIFSMSFRSADNVIFYCIIIHSFNSLIFSMRSFSVFLILDINFHFFTINRFHHFSFLTTFIEGAENIYHLANHDLRPNSLSLSPTIDFLDDFVLLISYFHSFKSSQCLQNRTV